MVGAAISRCRSTGVNGRHPQPTPVEQSDPEGSSTNTQPRAPGTATPGAIRCTGTLLGQGRSRNGSNSAMDLRPRRMLSRVGLAAATASSLLASLPSLVSLASLALPESLVSLPLVLVAEPLRSPALAAEPLLCVRMCLRASESALVTVPQRRQHHCRVSALPALSMHSASCTAVNFISNDAAAASGGSELAPPLLSAPRAA